MRDYSRQDGVLDQEKLRQARIAIAGNGNLAGYLCAYAAGLGIGNIRIFGSHGGFLTVDKLAEMNRDVRIDYINHPFDRHFVGSIDVLIDLTNNPQSKAEARHFSARHLIPYISASSSGCEGSIEIMPNKSRIEQIMCEPPSFSRYSGKKQGSFTSALLASIALDEARKIISPVDGDELASSLLEYSMHSENRFYGKVLPKSMHAKGKALVVGAGGIGTYVALNLAHIGIDMDIYDGDAIEGSNLNRQVFYYGRMGHNKADTLKERLQDIFKCNILSFPRHFTGKDSIGGYSAVFSCVDNPDARLMLSQMALESEIPLIDSGVTAFSARIEQFIPGKSVCLECRRGKEYDSRKGGTESCATAHSGNIVMSNAFAAAFACAEFLREENNLADKRFTYLSKPGSLKRFRIAGHGENCGGNCGCRCHELIRKRREHEKL